MTDKKSEGAIGCVAMGLGLIIAVVAQIVALSVIITGVLWILRSFGVIG